MSNYKESTMGTCKTCGSHAINPGLNGRPTFDKLVDHDLCDVCFWSTRFQSAADEIDRLRAENEALKRVKVSANDVIREIIEQAHIAGQQNAGDSCVLAARRYCDALFPPNA